MMDNKGLNINLPLLSVRRFSSKKNANRKPESYLPVRPSTDSCKTGSSSIPMMNPGTVPFGWEHSPGRPKNEKNKQIQSIESPLSTPKLSSGRFFRSKKMNKPECSKSTKNDSSDSLVDDNEYDNVMLGRFLPAARAMASDAQEEKKLVMNYNHDKQEEEDDEYDSDYEYNEHGKKSSKFCGLIPRFCSVNHPVHETSVRVKLPISPACKTQASSSSGNSLRETNSEPARSGAFKHISTSAVLKSEFIEPANVEGSKLYTCLQGPAITVDLSGSFQSTVSEQSDSSSKKKSASFRELLADKKNTTEIIESPKETSSQDSIIEKTLYVDSVQIIESPKETASSSSTKLHSCFNQSLESEHDESKQDMKTRKNKDLDHDNDAGLDWFDDDDDLKSNLKLKGYDPSFFEHFGPPPLPKSPSDSWLCRVLPSAPTKKAPECFVQIYASSDTVTDDLNTEENIQLQSPQEQRSPVPES